MKDGYVLVCVGDEKKVSCLCGLEDGVRQMMILTTYEMVEEANELGFPYVIRCTQNPQALLHLPQCISRVVIGSDMLPTIRFFMELIRFHRNAPVALITRNKQCPVKLYETIGAKVVYTNCDNLLPFIPCIGEEAQWGVH